MSNNLALWASVERTDPDHVKPITGKAYQGTSPKPHYLIHKATGTFGPCGIGWGFVVEERIEDGAMIEPGFFEKMHIAKVKLWYKLGDQRGEVEHIGGTVFSGKRKNGTPFTDEDAPKKSVTDALVKALSMLGFAGDIFMGRYDDSKYVSELREEARDAANRQDDSGGDLNRYDDLAVSIMDDLSSAKTIEQLNVISSQRKAETERLPEKHLNRVRAHYAKTRDRIAPRKAA